jgi:hypothetical protein
VGRNRTTQQIRALDVVVLGPAMMLGATQIENPTLRVIVGVGGITTFLYNLGNYQAVQRRRRREQGR